MASTRVFFRMINILQWLLLRYVASSRLGTEMKDVDDFWQMDFNN